MKKLLTAVLLTATVISALPSWAQLGSCYNCYSDGQYLYCSLLQPNGGRTCKQPNPYSCILEGACGSGGCFLAGTLVETEKGPVPIEQLVIGGKVFGAAEEGGGTERCAITRTYKSIECGYYVINGSISVTGSHPFRVGDGWTTAGKLEVGDELFGKDGACVVVESIEKVNRGVRAYNIEVDGAHSFFVEGILVHNKGPDPRG